jgi:tetratricopeptide (TPR) repeat protein/polyferredoxin
MQGLDMMADSAKPGCAAPRAQPAATKPTVRRSRMGRWRAAVLIAVQVLIAVHIAHWLSSHRTLTPLEPSEAMEFGKHGLINAGLIFFTLTILSTLVFGRFFCGWACHLVALQDLCRWLLGKIRIKPRPMRSRALALVPLGAFIYMFVFPALHRLWLGESLHVTGVRMTTSEFWATFPGWPIAVLTFLVCGFAIVYFLGSKGFCTYACPYGAIFGLADRIAPGSIRVTEACNGCGHCTAACSSNVRVHENVRDFGMVVDPGCLKCMDCVSVCPNDALYFGFGAPSLVAQLGSKKKLRRLGGYTLGEEVLLGVFFLLSLFVVRGLYDAVPFLFSLGLSCILAYLALQLLRLAYARHLALHHWCLKRGGRLTRAGYAFVAVMVLVTVFWIHSAFVQYHTKLGRYFYAQTADLRPASFGALLTSRPLTPGDRQRIDRALGHLRIAHDWALLHNGQSDLELAWLYLLKGDLDRVERHMTSALARQPDNAGIRFEFGNLLTAQGRMHRAAAMYRRVIELQPDWIDAYLNLGQSLAALGDWAAAAQAYQRGLQIDVGAAELQYNLGVVEAMRGDLSRAVERFRRAVELKPSLREARHNLAGALCSLGRFKEGIAEYQALLADDPDDADLHQLIGLAYLETEQPDQAEKHFRRMIECAPHRPEGHAQLAQVLLERGDVEGAARERAAAERLRRAASAPQPKRD